MSRCARSLVEAHCSASSVTSRSFLEFTSSLKAASSCVAIEYSHLKNCSHFVFGYKNDAHIATAEVDITLVAEGWDRGFVKMLLKRVLVFIVLSMLFNVSSCRFHRGTRRSFGKEIPKNLTPKTPKISLPPAVTGIPKGLTPKISLPPVATGGVPVDLTSKTPKTSRTSSITAVPGGLILTKSTTTVSSARKSKRRSKTSVDRIVDPAKKTSKKTKTDQPRNGERKDIKTECNLVEKGYAIYSCVSETEMYCNGWSTKRVKLERCHCAKQRRPRLTVCSTKWCQEDQCNLDSDVCHSKDIPIKPTNCRCENPSSDGTYCEQWSCIESITGRDYRCSENHDSGLFCFEWEGNSTVNDSKKSPGCFCLGVEGDSFCKEWWCGDAGIKIDCREGNGKGKRRNKKSD